MFTGIIEEVGTVQRIGGGSLAIAAETVLTDAHLGDSIAVNGICLTVTSFDRHHFTADVMPETVRRTSLAELRKGSPVNLERALEKEGNALLLKVAAEPAILRGIVEKGSVALDGISLTVAAVTEEDFTVSLIPHTREVTNLRDKKTGSILNIETDVIGKYVEKMMQGVYTQEGSKAVPEKSALTRAFLLENGF